MRVAVLTLDPAARIAVRLLSALSNSPHHIVAVIAAREVPSADDDPRQADWEALQRLARNQPSPLDGAPQHDLLGSLGALLQRYSFPYHVVDDLRDIECQELIRASGADLMILAAAPLLPREVFGIPRYGSINFHAGVVPWYRGTAALYHALCNRDLLGVGYTLHEVDDGVDTGDVLFKEVVPVLPGDGVIAILDRCERAAAPALVRIVSGLDSGACLPRTSQRGLPGRTYRGIPTALQWQELESLMTTAEWHAWLSGARV
jgi:methionyl-tRNA formyltransferase